MTETNPFGKWRRSAVALTVTECDTAGTRGLLADLRAFAAVGVRARCAVTRVRVAGNVAELAVEAVRAQVDAGMPADATKTGALGPEAIVRAVAEVLDYAAPERLVVDASLVDADGQPWGNAAAHNAVAGHLANRALVLAVNRFEAELLCGQRVHDLAGMREAGKRLFDLGPRSVLLTAGRMEGHAVDLVYDGAGFIEFGADRVRLERLSGTGETLTGALTAELARGTPLLEAVDAARRCVVRAVASPAILRDRSPVAEALAGLYAAAGVDVTPVEVEA